MLLEAASLHALTCRCHTLLHSWRMGTTENQAPHIQGLCEALSNSFWPHRWSAAALMHTVKAFQESTGRIGRDTGASISARPLLELGSAAETSGYCIPFVHCGAAPPLPCWNNAAGSSEQQALHTFQGKQSFPQVCIFLCRIPCSGYGSDLGHGRWLPPLARWCQGEEGARWILITFWPPVPWPGKYLFMWLETECATYI